MTSMKLLGAAAALMLGGASLAQAQAFKREGGKATGMILLTKFRGILVFDQARSPRPPRPRRRRATR